MKELHLTKKDFKIDWYSGTGAGGQHRNKHQNCCKITHIESGLMAIGTESKSREINKVTAFKRLSKKIINKWLIDNQDEFNKEDMEVVRNYNKSRNEVHDYSSGLKQSYKKVVDKNDISDMIIYRRISKIY